MNAFKILLTEVNDYNNGMFLAFDRITKDKHHQKQ